MTQELNSRLIPFFTFVESKRKGLLLEVKRKSTELGRNSFAYGPEYCGMEFT